MRIETILNAEFALNRDHPLQKAQWQDFRNPAQWKNHLQVIFKSSGKQQKSHFEAMPFANAPAFMAELGRRADYSALALAFTIHCAVRTNEALGALWTEFDMVGGVWTIPAERMKAGMEHRVPLTAAVVQILKSVPKIEGNPYVFAGAKEGRPL